MIKIENNSCRTCVASGVGCAILTNCSASTLQSISNAKRTFRYRRGSDILHEGSFSNGVYFISSGKVMLYKTEPDGGKLILHFLKHGDMIGFRNRQQHFRQPLSVRVIEDTNFCYLTHEDFNRLLAEAPELSFSMLTYYEHELDRIEQRAYQLANYSVKQKIAAALLDFADIFGFKKGSQTLDINISREDLARFSGTTKEQVSKALHEFKANNLVFLKAKRIDLLNADGLKKIVES